MSNSAIKPAIEYYGIFENFKSSLENVFTVIGNELVNLRCAILVVKGYTKDYYTQSDKDLEIAFNEEMVTYQESVMNMKNKIASLISELEDLQQKQYHYQSINSPPEELKLLLDLYNRTRNNLFELTEELNSIILRKQFEYSEIITIGGVNPSLYSLDKINTTYTDSLSNIAGASKLTKEGIRLKNLIASELEEIKNKYFTNKKEKEELENKRNQFTEANIDNIINILKDGMENVEGQSFDPRKPVVDGDIELKVDRSGIYIKIISPSNGGMPINLPEIKSVLKGNKINYPNEKILQKILEAKPNDFIKICDWQTNPKLDACIKIIFKENKAEAYALIKAAKFSGKDIDAQDFKKAIEKNNIRYGIIKERIDRLIKKPIYNKEILIARGKKAIKGDNAEFIFYFNTTIDKKPVLNEEGKVNYKELHLIQNIEPNTLIADKIPPKNGTPGINVCNETIPATLGDDKELKIIQGAEYRDEGQKIYSTKAGHLRIKKNEIEVSPLYVVYGDVNYETGNIDFNGSILVKGSVDDEFEIIANGDVEIMGNVYKSKVKAEKNIFIHQGINGREEGYVEAGKSITTKYIENAYVKAKENIIVTNNILHSNVNAGGSIKCHGKGLIAGGKIICNNNIICKVIGSNANVHTTIEIGYDALLIEKQKQIIFEIYEVKKYIDRAKELMMKIKDKAEQSKRIYRRFVNIKRAGRDKLIELDELKNKLETINETISKTAEKSYTKADITYPNVELRIGKSVKKTNNITNFHHEIRLIKGEIKLIHIAKNKVCNKKLQ